MVSYKCRCRVKFSRDLDSGWTVKNDKPDYGLKEDASVDINHGFILASILTPSSVHDTNYLPCLSDWHRLALLGYDPAYVRLLWDSVGVSASFL